MLSSLVKKPLRLLLQVLLLSSNILYEVFGASVLKMRKPLLKSTFIPLVLSIVVFSFANVSYGQSTDTLIFPTPLSNVTRGSGTGSGGATYYAQNNKIYFDSTMARISYLYVAFPIPDLVVGTTTIKGEFTDVSGTGADLCRVGITRVSTPTNYQTFSTVGTPLSTSTPQSFELSYYNNSTIYPYLGFYVGNPTSETTIQSCKGYISSITYNGVELFGITDLPITLGGGTNELDMATTTKVIEVFSTQFLFYSLIMIVIASITLIFTIRKR